MDTKVFLKLGRKYLSKKGQAAMETLIHREDFEAVQAGLLGAIDRAWLSGKISSEEAQHDYRLLDIDPELARKSRQKAANTEIKFNRPK